MKSMQALPRISPKALDRPAGKNKIAERALRHSVSSPGASSAALPDLRTLDDWLSQLKITEPNKDCGGKMVFIGRKPRRPFNTEKTYHPEKVGLNRTEKGQIYYAQMGQNIAGTPHFHKTFEEVYKFVEGTGRLKITLISLDENGKPDQNSMRVVYANPGDKVRIPQNTIHFATMRDADDWAVLKVDTYDGYDQEQTQTVEIEDLPEEAQIARSDFDFIPKSVIRKLIDPPAKPTDTKISDFDIFIRACQKFKDDAAFKTQLIANLNRTSSIQTAIRRKGGGVQVGQDNFSFEIFGILNNKDLNLETSEIYQQVGLRTRSIWALAALNEVGALNDAQRQCLMDHLFGVYFFSTVAADGSDAYKLSNFGQEVNAAENPTIDRNLGEDLGAIVVRLETGKTYNTVKHQSSHGFKYAETWSFFAQPSSTGEESRGVFRYIDPDTHEVTEIELKNGTSFTLPCNSAFTFTQISGPPMAALITNRTMWRVLEDGTDAYITKPTEAEVAQLNG